MRYRRMLRTAVYTLLIGFIAAATAIALVAGTPAGSRWLIGQAIGLSGEPLTIERIDGTLLHGLALTGVRYASDPVVVHLDELEFQWRPLGLLSGGLSVDELTARALDIELSAADQQTEPHTPFVFPDLPVGISIGRSQVHDITITRDGEAQRIDRIALSGSIDDGGIGIKQLQVVAPDFGITVDGRLAARPPHTIKARVEWYAGDPKSSSAAGNARLHGALSDIAFTHVLTRPLHVESKGTLQQLTTDPRVKADSTAPAQSLASIGLPGWTLNESTAHTEGWIDRYRWTADLNVNGEGYPRSRADTGGHGNLSGLVFDRFDIRTLDGRLTGRGELKWQPRVEWRADVKGESINPEAIYAGGKGSIDLSAENNGYYDYDQDRYQVNTADLTLDGNIGRYPVSARGGLDISTDAVHARKLNIRLGANRFSFNGSLTDKARRDIDLAWDIDAPDLSVIPIPGENTLNGSVSGNGYIGATLSDPQLTAELTATDLTYGTGSIETLRIDAQGLPAGGHFLRVTSKGLALDSRRIDGIEVTVRGKPANHSIELTTRSESVNTVLTVSNAALDLQADTPRRWQGTVERLDAETAFAGHWSLERPATTLISPARVSLDRSCLRQNNARLCADVQWSSAEGFDTRGSLHRIPMTLLHPFITSNTRLEGHVNGDFTVTGASSSIQSQVTLNAPAGRFVITGDDNETDDYPWRGLQAELTRKGGTLDTRIDFNLGTLGNINGNLTLEPDERIRGELGIAIEDIGWMELLSPRARALTGSLNVDAAFSGTRSDPRIELDASVSDAGADIPALGISITDTHVTVDGDNNRFNIEATAHSGSGRLNVEGRMHVKPDLSYTLDLAVTGEQFEIAHLPRIDAQIAPDVRFRLTPAVAEVTGVVTLPSVHVTMKTMPTSAVSISPDAQTVDAPAPPGAGVNGREMTANIKLKLGDDVHFNGFGLETRLAGELDLNQAPGQPPLAYGELEVVEGRYKAYGQKLQIDGGRLIFQGPYDNPALSVRAVRETPDATVGLQISGTLKQPRSRVFSEPPVSDSEAMALLLTGRSLSSASESDANMLINAVASLGMERSQGITRQIADTFNLDNVQIKAGSGFEEGSLLLGKHLSPRLYIEYAVGFVDQSGLINLEYRLSEHLKLEAQSGDERSMDLMYKIER